ncbi:hypothetical protein VST52_07315 [Pseudomonas aeruginosa]|uniref:hypothetical protein n=1 Tax=Pseudomonas aeruginosa TaxID=287 RepID=UPI0039822D84
MTESKICTCPSGDGSLRWPCPKHPAVEQAGGDERAAFEAAFAAMGRPVCRADYDQDAYGTPFDDGGWTGWQARAALARPSQAQAEQAEGAHVPDEVFAGVFAEWWEEEGQYCRAGGGDYERTFAFQAWRHLYPLLLQARAALAQPSPVRSSLLINGYQLRAALDFIAPDGTAEQLESEACIEWRQQDADFLEAGLYAFCAEYPEEGGVLLDEEPSTGQPSPLQSEQAEAERPEVVGYLGRRIGMSEPGFHRSAEDAGYPGPGRKALIDLEQHERIVGELRAENAKLSEALDECDGDRWKLRSERDAANARLHEVATACATAEQERDAALARVADMKTMADNYCALLMDANAKLAEMERQEPVALANRGLHAFWVKWTEAAAGLYGPGIKLYAAPVAQAQQLHDLDKQCRDDVARALGLRPNQERGFAWSYLLASIKSRVKASGDSAQAQHSVPIAPELKRALGLVVAALEADGDRPTSKYALSELKKVLAGAPGKEGV